MSLAQSVEIIPYVPKRVVPDPELRQRLHPACIASSAWKGLEEILPDIIERFGVKNDFAMEFGVWHGYSCAALAQHFKRVIGIDTFMGDRMAGFAEQSMLATTRETMKPWPNISLIESSWQDVLSNKEFLADINIPDFFHVDILHTYEETLGCGRLCYKLNPRACFIFHDTESFPDVKKALIQLCSETGMHFYNYPHCHGLGILSHKKIADDVSMSFGITSLRWEGSTNCIRSWFNTASKLYQYRIVYNRPLLEAYNTLLCELDSDVLALIHDDVVIHEQNWDLRVLKEFEDPTVGMVGFGGARGHGDPQMYKIPYEMNQFARRGFMSNMRNAEAHGARFTGERDVAVFDGFALFIRRKILEKAGGWPDAEKTGINYWCYDYWISMEVRRQGYRNRLVGVDCDHLGGKSPSILPNEDIDKAHRWLYENYRDVMPYEAQP